MFISIHVTWCYILILQYALTVYNKYKLRKWVYNFLDLSCKQEQLCCLSKRPKCPTVDLNQICSTLKKGCDNSTFQNFIYFLTDFQDIYFCELDVDIVVAVT